MKYYAAVLYSIYIQYTLDSEGDSQKIYEVFLKYAGYDMIVELVAEKHYRT